MKRWRGWLWLCALAVGCGGPLPEQEPSAGEASEEVAAPEPDAEVSALWKRPRVELGQAYLVKDILPPEEQPPEAGFDAPRPRGLVDFEGRVYFTVSSAPRGETTLWRSDGTAPGTVPLVSVPDPTASSIRELTVVGDRLFFVLRTGAHGDELWASDGTASGTGQVRFFTEETTVLNQLRAVGDTLFFFHVVIGATETRDELWTSDGTASGTRLVRDLGQGLLIQDPTAAHGQLFFALFPQNADGDLWVSDGTASGTRKVRDSGSGPVGLVEAGGDLYYSASDPEHGRELWTSDGTRKGTRLVADLTPGPADSPGLHLLSETDDRLYFTIDDPASTGLLLYKVRVDGSCHHRPVRVAAIPNFFPENPDVSRPFVLLSTGTGGRLYFVVEYGLFAGLPFEAQLWVSNGTGSGTRLLSRSLLGADVPIAPLTPVGDGRIVFSARDPEHGLEPWVSDGTPGGTRLLQELVPGPAGSGPREFTRSDGFVFFVAHTPETGNELWALPLLTGGHRTAGR